MIFIPQWKFIHVNALTMETIGPLQNAKGLSLALVHNRPGSLSFSISMDAEESEDIYALTSGVKAMRRNTKGLWTCEWSGKVTNMNENWTDGTIDYTVDGWYQHLEKRFVRRQKDYRAVNPATGMFWSDAEIIHDIVNEMNIENIAWQIDQNGLPFDYYIPKPFQSDGLANMPTPVWVGGKNGSFHPNNERRFVVEPRGQALSTITSLTDIENGCDIRQDPLTRQLSVYTKYGQTRDVEFGFRTMPNNLRDFGREVGTDELINFMVTSSQQGNVIQQYADTRSFPAPANPAKPIIGENSMLSYGLLEEEQTIAVGSGGQPAETLRVFSASEVLLRSAPREIYRALPLNLTGLDQVGNVPEPFEDYEIGDKVYLSARRGRRSIKDQLVRIYGMTINPDDSNGSEIISSMQVSL